MNAAALTLVVAGAILHALWNLFAKKASGGLPFVWLFGVVSLAVALPFGAAAWQPGAQQLTGRAWGIITGLSIAVYTVIDGWAVKAIGIAPALYYSLGLALRTAMLTPQALRDPEGLRTQWRLN